MAGRLIDVVPPSGLGRPSVPWQNGRRNDPALRGEPMTLRTALILGAIALLASPSLAQVTVPAGAAREHDIRPGPGVTATKMLSDWAPALKSTPGDTPVYVLEGKEPGATVFVHATYVIDAGTNTARFA